MIRGLLLRARLSRLWVKALSLVARHQFAEALEKLNIIERRSGDAMSKPTELNVQMRILKAVALSRLKRWRETLKLLEDLQPVLMRQGLGEQGKYLAGYASCLAQETIDQSGQKEFQQPLQPLLSVKLDQINLAKVPARLKANFPLIVHSPSTSKFKH
jgi:hypothetical protein